MATFRSPHRWTALAVITLALAGAAVTYGWLPLPAARAQGPDEQPSTERLTRDIQFLSLLRNLDVTAEQRRGAADAIADFGEKRAAIMKLAQPEELVSALATVRDTLLRGEHPTDEMHEAVAAARPPDDGSIDQAFMQARSELLTTLEALLTEDQKKELAILPLVDVANDIIFMAVDSRDAPQAEREELRTNSFGELRDQLAAAAGADSGVVLADFQARVDHLFGLTPEQVEQQHAQLVERTVVTLSNAFLRNPEVMGERLRDQLFEWAMEPGLGELLAESAAAMEAE